MASLRGIYTIWFRELLRFVREPARIVATIAQPLLYLAVVGKGIASTMSINGAPGGMDYLKFMYPGIIGMSLLFTSIFSGVSIIWDREFGFLKEVLVAPVPRWAVAVGKILGGSTVAVLQSVIIIVLAPMIGVGVTAKMVLLLIALSFILSFAVTGLGVAIAARMDSMQGFQMIMNFMIMPLYFLSGAMFPITTSPQWMKSVMTINPLSYGVDAIRNVIFSDTMIQVGPVTRPLVEVARAAGLIRWDLALDAAVLAGLAVLLASVAAVTFSTAD